MRTCGLFLWFGFGFGDTMGSMLKIEIKTIPDTEQRYDTVGDYQTKADGSQTITVSDMADSRYEFLIALHELIESYLCKERDITDAMIDAFDMEYERTREPGNVDDEPGDDSTAPYHQEHLFATKMEKLMAQELGVDWEEYVRAYRALTGNN